jgi:creatinine amidohydrolase
MPRTALIEELTLPELQEFRPEVVLIPVGSTEQHAYHLPYGTDTWRVLEHCRRAAEWANERGGRVVVMPAMPYGVNTNFTAWPFTVRIRVETLLAVVTDLVTELDRDGVRKMVIVNGHGGNVWPLRAFTRQIHGQIRGMVVVVDAGGYVPDAVEEEVWERGQGVHAGEGETSEILYLRPETVRMEAAKAPNVTPPKLRTLDAIGATYVKWWHQHTDTGGVGDPTAATAEKGRRWLEASAEALGAFLKEFSEAKVDERFPF